MLNVQWEDKSLMTTLGSWAELRHDTILYGKQSSIAVPSGATPPPPKREGYVEPYPEVYARLTSLVGLLKHGLNERGLINPGLLVVIDNTKEIYQRLTELSIKELNNEPLNDTDYNYIKKVGTKFSDLIGYLSDFVSDYTSPADEKMAIIADVHTDLHNGEVLEVAVGNPLVIYVVVQDHNGRLRLTRGGIFSYYEFPHPYTSRLTDEEWQDILVTNPPDLPDWIIDSPAIEMMKVLVLNPKKK
ncbi:MAG: DUF3160 domain-containing protein, partial [Candidatus Heimdallarchaeaceae archaeon]|jgi:hypothetical protein